MYVVHVYEWYVFVMCGVWVYLVHEWYVCVCVCVCVCTRVCVM